VKWVLEAIATTPNSGIVGKPVTGQHNPASNVLARSIDGLPVTRPRSGKVLHIGYAVSIAADCCTIAACGFVRFLHGTPVSAQTLETEMIDGPNEHSIANTCVNFWPRRRTERPVAHSTDRNGIAPYV
jgi:hypothetical protein